MNVAKAARFTTKPEGISISACGFAVFSLILRVVRMLRMFTMKKHAIHVRSKLAVSVSESTGSHHRRFCL
jgi:hypothetical protein